MVHVFDLKFNNFSRPIPINLSKMIDLGILDLSHNNLSGTIPSSLQSLSFLSFFSVAYNQLYGRIPYGGQFQTFPSSGFEGNCGDPRSRCHQDRHESPKRSRRNTRFKSFAIWWFDVPCWLCSTGAMNQIGPLASIYDENESVSLIRTRGIASLKWKNSNPQTIKGNCDASCASNSRWAGIVAIARDSARIMIDGCNAVVQTASARVAEAMAICLDATSIRSGYGNDLLSKWLAETLLSR
ncbi:hypothetical protein GOBAR_DD34744 [Gossypium barbadense]|nr:hypothetical protein GOBAR_DD34744 [Gossypium barbadense]